MRSLGIPALQGGEVQVIEGKARGPGGGPDAPLVATRPHSGIRTKS